MNDNERNEIKAAVAEAVTESGVLTDGEVRRIVKDAVRQTLRESGIDPDDTKALSDDLRYVRDWRKTTDKIRDKSIMAIVTLLVSGFVAVVWLGFKAMLHK